MKRPKFIKLSKVVALFSAIAFYACVSDVDFEQGENFSFLQENTVTLIFFDLTAEDFQDPIIPGVSRDTTGLDVFDGIIQKNLISAEFLFRIENTFSQDANVEIEFLTEDNTEAYTINFPIDGGSPANPNVTTFVQLVINEDLDRLKTSTNVAIEIILEDNGQPVEGTINFRSKADFVLELGGESTQ